MSERSPSSSRGPLPIVNVVGSVFAAAALFGVHLVWDSDLALAQAADSTSDVLTGTLLAWAARQAEAPADDDHPLGHTRAEPIAALVVAVLAGLLAAAVLRAAFESIVTGAAPRLEWPVAAVFLGKVVFKLGIAGAARRSLRERPSPVIDALRVDAQNDAVVGTVALIGFGLARAQLPAVDPVLAILVAIYVGVSSVRLARTSVSLLLGTSAPAERVSALRAVAAGTEGVLGVSRLVAITHGAALHVEAEVEVNGALRVDEAHRIAHAVEARLRAEADVAHAMVHVGPRE